MGTVGSGDRPGEDKGLEPFGKDGAGHAGNAPADVIEAAAAAQDFPYDQEGPPTAQHFVGTRHGAELSVSCHAEQISTPSRKFRYGFRTGSWPDVMALSTGVVPLRTGKSGMSGFHPCTNPLRGVGAVGELYSAPEPLADAASKVGALPQTPPGTEPLDLNAYARFR